MRKKILSPELLIITFLLSLIVIYSSGFKVSNIQKESKIISNQPEYPSRIEMVEKEREDYFKKRERGEYLKRIESKLWFKAEALNVDLVGKWPYGPCRASALDTLRDIALVSNGEALQILDISTPYMPSKVGEVILQENVQGIAISGNYAYVLTRSSLKIIDISTLSSPDEVGSVDISGYGYSLEISSNYAYVAAEEGGLRIYDILAPDNPFLVGFYTDSDFGEDIWVYDVALWDTYVFIINDYYTGSDWIYQLRIIDVNTPSNPSLTGTYDGETDWIFSGVDASDTGYAYLSQYIEGASYNTGYLSIIDVATDPANPTEVGQYGGSYKGFVDVEASGNYAYLFEMEDWVLEIIDISTPSAPFCVGECEGEGNTIYLFDGLYLSGDYLGISHNNLFGLYDVSDANNPSHEGSYDTPDEIRDYPNTIAVSGDYAYMASRSDGLRILDISTPSNPSETGICDTVYARYAVYISGNFAYGVDASGFWVVDISSPSSPYQVGYLDMTWTTRDVAISGNYAYVCGYQDVSGEYRVSLDVIDVSDPSNPSITGSYVGSSESYNYGGMDLSGDYVYIALIDYSTGNWKAGLKIIDISDTTAPSEAGTYISSDYGYSYDVEVRGNYAYLTGYEFKIIDISNPQSPSEVSSYPSFSRALEISGNYAYLGYDGLEILDISDPYNPVDAGYYYDDLEEAVFVSGNYAYVPGSLYILQNTLAPVVSITSPSPWTIVSGSVSIEAQASHSSGINKVEFYIDDVLKSTDFSSPYEYIWDTASVSESPHTIEARAYNNNSNSSSAEIEVKVGGEFTLTIYSTSGGTTDPEPGTYSYNAGEEASIEATPDSGYRISGWTGDVPSGHENDNPITITMDSDKSITANFVRQYSLTIAAGSGGTTNPSPGSYIHDNGTQVSITAVPSSGYQFSGWSGDVSGTNNPVTITVDADKSISANFTQTPTGDGDGDGESSGGGGCFIATAAYGSPLHPSVKVLRDFRDRYLMPNKIGRFLVNLYYKYSPSIANIIARSKPLKVVVRIHLFPIIVLIYSLVHLGPIITAGILLFILVLPIFFMSALLRK